MAQMPLDVLVIGGAGEKDVREAVEIGNSLQSEFLISRPVLLEEKAQWLGFKAAKSEELMDHLDVIRKEARGYHPYVIAIVDSYLDGVRFGNLFAGDRAEVGLGVLTTNGVPDVIIPESKLASYFLYYFGKFVLGLSFRLMKTMTSRRIVYSTEKSTSESFSAA